LLAPFFNRNALFSAFAAVSPLPLKDWLAIDRQLEASLDVRGEGVLRPKRGIDLALPTRREWPGGDEGAHRLARRNMQGDEPSGTRVTLATARQRECEPRDRLPGSFRKWRSAQRRLLGKCGKSEERSGKSSKDEAHGGVSGTLFPIEPRSKPRSSC
jgi:hypothetical protein